MHTSTAVEASPDKPRRWYHQLYFWVLGAIILGILLGWLAPSVGTAVEPIGTTFVSAMRMLIGPIVFLTIVAGIASVADLKKVGLTGLKALAYFQVGTTVALVMGLVAINIFRLATALTPSPTRSRAPTLPTSSSEPARANSGGSSSPTACQPASSDPSSTATSCRSSSSPSCSALPSTPPESTEHPFLTASSEPPLARLTGILHPNDDAARHPWHAGLEGRLSQDPLSAVVQFEVLALILAEQVEAT